MAREPERHERRDEEREEQRAKGSSPPAEPGTPPDPPPPSDAIEIGPGVMSTRSGQLPAGAGSRSPGESRDPAQHDPPRPSGSGQEKK